MIDLDAIEARAISADNLDGIERRSAKAHTIAAGQTTRRLVETARDVEPLVARVRELEAKPAAPVFWRAMERVVELESEVARLRAALAMDKPWPLPDVLRKLAWAADHLLDGHSCDVHGHEEIAEARDAARRILSAIFAEPKGDG